MSNLHLKENPTLQDFQQYVEEMRHERGFKARDTALRLCLLLGEEVGELFKAIRKQENLGVDRQRLDAYGSIEEELADVLIYLCSLANMHGIDLEKAFRDKEEINKKREWKPMN